MPGVSGMTCRVVLADDDVLLREGVASLLQRSGFDVVGQAGDGVTLLDLVGSLRPDLAIVDKKRSAPGVSEVMNIIGDVKDRRCVLFDDIVDSAGTLCNAAAALRKAGAASVSAYVTHGVLSGSAVERVTASELTELVITDSIETPEGMRDCPKIREITCATLIGEAIRRIANEESVSKLFD